MEIILAVVVAAAVIFFGALISMGNDRQCKAIDALREQTELWAMQDLRIKRERLAHDAKVDDPLVWLNSIATRISGLDLNLQTTIYFDETRTLLCTSGIQDTKVLFSPYSPNEIKRIKREKRSRLSQIGENNPLLSLPHGVPQYKISVLNAGVLFDLELQIAWKGLTGNNMKNIEKIWLYLV